MTSQAHTQPKAGMAVAVETEMAAAAMEAAEERVVAAAEERVTAGDMASPAITANRPARVASRPPRPVGACIGRRRPYSPTTAAADTRARAGNRQTLPSPRPPDPRRRIRS